MCCRAFVCAIVVKRGQRERLMSGRSAWMVLCAMLACTGGALAQVTYDIVFRDGALHVDRPTAPDGSLAPAGEDRFRVYRSWILEFARDGGSRISGFTVNMGRAKGVQFVREAPKTGGE